MPTEHPLDHVFPAGEIVDGWNGDSYWRGQPGRNGRTHALAVLRYYSDSVEPVWVIAHHRCPEYNSLADAWCCSGECEGGPVWQVVKERVPGTRRAWRATT
ncbi:MAG: hypothetical protein ACKVWR_21775 [Acidimicrobiales bacterium]